MYSGYLALCLARCWGHSCEQHSPGPALLIVRGAVGKWGHFYQVKGYGGSQGAEGYMPSWPGALSGYGGGEGFWERFLAQAEP